MSEPDELYPPVQYAAGWMLLALGIIALVIVAIWLILFLTRPRRTTQTASAPVAADALTMLRHEYLDGIGRIEQAWRDGRLTARQANLELSRTTRRFVNEYSGLEAPVLTLADLQARGVHPVLVDALRRHYYPSVFGRGPAVDPAAGAEAARRVVSEWR